MQEPCEHGLGEADAAMGAAAAPQLPGMHQGPSGTAAAVVCSGVSAPAVQLQGTQQGSQGGASTMSARHSAAQPAVATACAPQLPGQKQGASFGTAATAAGGCQPHPAGHCNAAAAALQPPGQRQGSRGGATTAGLNIAGSPINALLGSSMSSRSTPTAVAAPAGAQAAGRPHIAGPAGLEAHARPGMQPPAARPHARLRQERTPGSAANAHVAGVFHGGAAHGPVHHAAMQEHRGVSQPMPSVQPAPAQNAVPRAGQPAQLHCHPPKLVATLPMQGCNQRTYAASNLQTGPGAASSRAAAQAQELREALPSVAGAVAGMQDAGRPGERGSASTPALLQQGALPVLEHRLSAPAPADIQSDMNAAAGCGCPASAQPQQAPSSQPALGRGGTELSVAKSASALRPDAAVGGGASPMQPQQHSSALHAEGHKENLPAAANMQDAAACSPAGDNDAGASGQPHRALPSQVHLVPQRRSADKGAPEGAAKRRRAGTLLTPFSDSDSGDSGVWA